MGSIFLISSFHLQNNKSNLCCPPHAVFRSRPARKRNQNPGAILPGFLEHRQISGGSSGAAEFVPVSVVDLMWRSGVHTPAKNETIGPRPFIFPINAAVADVDERWSEHIKSLAHDFEFSKISAACTNDFHSLTESIHIRTM